MLKNGKLKEALYPAKVNASFKWYRQTHYLVLSALGFDMKHFTIEVLD